MDTDDTPKTMSTALGEMLSSGKTADLCEVVKAHPEWVRDGALLSDENIEPTSLLRLAIEYGNTDFALWLLDQGMPAEDLQGTLTVAAAQADLAPVLRRLIEVGGDIRSRDISKRTAAGAAESATLLHAALDLGADPNGRDGEQLLPLLHCHICKPDINMPMLLLGRGAKPDAIAGATGDAAVHHVSRQSSWEAVEYLARYELLERYGANLGLQNMTGQTALHLVTANPAIMRFFVEGQRVDINARDHLGQTALVKAVMAGQFGSAHELLKWGASPHVQPIPNAKDAPVKLTAYAYTQHRYHSARGANKEPWGKLLRAMDAATEARVEQRTVVMDTGSPPATTRRGLKL